MWYSIKPAKPVYNVTLTCNILCRKQYTYLLSEIKMLWLAVWITIALSVTTAVAAEPAIDIGGNVNAEGNSNQENMDVNIPGLDGKLPSPDELLKMLDSMSNLSDDEKNDLREHLMKSNPDIEINIPPAAGNNFFNQIGLLLSLLSVIAIIFVFIGFKLYNGLIEREKRRELKKKQKELKKKK